VQDASSPVREEQRQQVERVLGELEAKDKPMLHVMNKVDLLSAEERASLPAGSIAVSGLTGEGVDALLAAIDAALVADPLVEATLRIPQSEGAVLAALEAGVVLRARRFEGNLVYVEARGPESLLERYRRFWAQEQGGGKAGKKLRKPAD
jgi:GTPase